MKKKTAFGFEKPEYSPGFLLWQTTVLWQRLIRKELDQHNLSHAQFVVMASLLWFEEQGESVTQVDIISMSKLDKMTVSSSLKKLADQKLVKRSESAQDTRAKNVVLTKQGRGKVQSLVPRIEAIDEEFFGVCSLKEQKALIQTFQKLKKENK